VFETALKAHHDNDMIMDIPAGPNQGQGVPAHGNEEGLLWDLNPVETVIASGGSFDDKIPGWGTGKLQAVIIGDVIKEANTSSAAPSLPNDPSEQRLQKTLRTNSLEDVTNKVSLSGHLTVNFTKDQSGSVIEHMLMAVYLVRSNERAQQPPGALTGPQTAPKTWIQNGSWTVDHFSAKGAQVVTDFWDKYMLTGPIKNLIKKVGNYFWEDSIEINPNIYWTPELPEVFETRRGYSINKWYPVLFHQNSLTEHFTTWYITDESDAGDSHIADYRTTASPPLFIYRIAREYVSNS
jgi:hypothetical protein